MDWIAPLTGLVGAGVGAAASVYTTVRVLKHQLADARQARREAEQIAVVGSLSQALAALHKHARGIPVDLRHRRDLPDRPQAMQRFFEEEREWDKPWMELLRTARTAALGIRDAEPRQRVLNGLTYLGNVNALEYATYGKDRSWVLRRTIDDMEECVYAWRRGDAELPAPSEVYKDVEDSWKQKMDEYEENERSQAEWRREQRAGGASSS
jgi:hypothetical protein